MVPFGDTEYFKGSTAPFYKETFGGQLVLPQTGFIAMHRSYQNGKLHSYLAMQAAFHSRVHKHADDLAIVWYDRNGLIITDAGKYGYFNKGPLSAEQKKLGFWYSDPKRVYVESTRAHSTVEINGADQDRVNRKPYGSGLLAWGQTENCDLMYASAKVAQSGDFEHTRFLVLSPAKWLLVIDNIETQTSNNNYRQWFQLAPELTVQPSPTGYFVTGGTLNEGLYVRTLTAEARPREPVRGQTAPLQGWWSSKLGVFEPITSICFEINNAGRGLFTTLFDLDDFHSESQELLEVGKQDSEKNIEIFWEGQNGYNKIHICGLDTDAPVLKGEIDGQEIHNILSIID